MIRPEERGDQSQMPINIGEYANGQIPSVFWDLGDRRPASSPGEVDVPSIQSPRMPHQPNYDDGRASTLGTLEYDPIDEYEQQPG